MFSAVIALGNCYLVCFYSLETYLSASVQKMISWVGWVLKGVFWGLNAFYFYDIWYLRVDQCLLMCLSNSGALQLGLWCIISAQSPATAHPCIHLRHCNCILNSKSVSGS